MPHLLVQNRQPGVNNLCSFQRVRLSRGCHLSFSQAFPGDATTAVCVLQCCEWEVRGRTMSTSIPAPSRACGSEERGKGSAVFGR